MDERPRFNLTQCIRNTLKIHKEYKKVYHVNNKYRWPGVAISDKIDLNTKNITKDKERNFVIITGGFLGGPVVKDLPANAGDMGPIPGLGRSPGGENGNPILYSCLENSMDRGDWWTTYTP